jgi:hypothetical protein
MSNTPTVPPPIQKAPVLSPEALRIVVVGGILFLAIMGADVALELTGHGGSAVASVLTKGLAAVVGAGATFLAARAPGPQQAALEKQVDALHKQV